MRRRKFRAPQRKTLRRWRVPPALTHGESDAFEGLTVLDEVPGELGLLLWQSLRDATLWGRSSQAEREALFTAGAEQARIAAILTAPAPGELEDPLKTIAALGGSAALAREEHIALACRQVAQWAEERGLLATGLAFAQAASVVTPADPSGAYAVGRLARRRGEQARAETWFRRTVALARQAGDWPVYALAFVGLGNLYAQRGQAAAARRFHLRALRAAGRNSLHDIQGTALHDLFGIAVQAGDPADAHRLASEALVAYGPQHPRLPLLAHDVAALWTAHGAWDDAVPVLRGVLARAADPAQRARVLGELGRACGGAGDREGFLEAWSETVEHGMLGADGESAALAWLDLARGALDLAAWERAEDAAARAFEAANRAGDSRLGATAHEVQDAARRHLRADRNPGRELPPWTEHAAQLRRELVSALE